MGDLLEPAALDAARQWADDHGHPQPDDRMLAAYGAVIAEQVRQATADTIARAILANCGYMHDRLDSDPCEDCEHHAAIARRAGDGDGTATT